MTAVVPPVTRVEIEIVRQTNKRGVRYYQVWAVLGSRSKMECADEPLEAYRLGLVMARELVGNDTPITGVRLVDRTDDTTVVAEVTF